VSVVIVSNSASVSEYLIRLFGENKGLSTFAGGLIIIRKLKATTNPIIQLQRWRGIFDFQVPTV